MTPRLWQVLDSYLNTGDYDDYLDGYVSIEPLVGGDRQAYVVTFQPREGEPTRWTLVAENR